MRKLFLSFTLINLISVIPFLLIKAINSNTETINHKQPFDIKNNIYNCFKENNSTDNCLFKYIFHSNSNSKFNKIDRESGINIQSSPIISESVSKYSIMNSEDNIEFSQNIYRSNKEGNKHYFNIDVSDILNQLEYNDENQSLKKTDHTDTNTSVKATYISTGVYDIKDIMTKVYIMLLLVVLLG